MKPDLIVQDRVYSWVKTLTALPVEYELLPASGLPCLSVQTLTGSPIERRYKNGSYIANYRFALYLRQDGSDTAGRIDALSVLTDIAAKIDGGSIDLGASVSLWRIEQDTLPCRIAVDEHYDDYQVTFTVKYRTTI